MDGLMGDYSNEIGPPEERAAFARHVQWVLHSGGTVRGLDLAASARANQGGIAALSGLAA